MEHKNIQSIFSLEDNEAAEVKRIKLLIAEDVNLNIQCSVTEEVTVLSNFLAHESAGKLYPTTWLNDTVTNNIGRKHKWSLLMHETLKGYAKVVKLLLNLKLKSKMNINLADDEGFTALMVAACKGHATIAEMLLNANVNTEARFRNGETALIFAAGYGYVQVTATLLEDRENVDKANVNAKNNDGNTALILALRFGHIKVVETLLDANADINIKNNDGYTALDCTVTPEIADLLKQHISES